MYMMAGMVIRVDKWSTATLEVMEKPIYCCKGCYDLQGLITKNQAKQYFPRNKKGSTHKYAESLS